MCRIGNFPDCTHRICIGTVLERKRFRSHGRRCGRTDGAFHFLGPGQTSVCTHHSSAYLYLGLTYGGYPYLVKLLVPKRLRAIKMTSKKPPKNYDAKVKLAFSAILCAVLCFLFPVASPLFFSLFLGVAVRESGMKHIYDFVSGPLLYGSTFMLGLLLGVLCDAHLLLDPKILKLLVLGMGALLLSGIGGIIGGYIMYFIKRGNYNPVIGIAAVSCVPTTAKVAQKIVSKDNPNSFILGDALGANISGVITSAIITGIYITIIPYL